MRVHTRSLSGSESLVITKDLNVIQISVQPATSSSATVLGDLPFDGEPGTAVTLAAGTTFTLTAPNSMTPIDGLTITNTSGTTDVVISVQ